MINLQQEKYKTDNGQEIDASVVEVLGSYQHIADGFYNWTCGRCSTQRTDRSCGWPISGQVIRCEKCTAMNLLVRTNCAEIDEALSGKWRAPERDAELERLRGIVEINESKVRDVKQRLSPEVRTVIANWRLPAELQQETTAEVAADEVEGTTP